MKIKLCMHQLNQLNQRSLYHGWCSGWQRIGLVWCVFLGFSFQSLKNAKHVKSELAEFDLIIVVANNEDFLQDEIHGWTSFHRGCCQRTQSTMKFNEIKQLLLMKLETLWWKAYRWDMTMGLESASRTFRMASASKKDLISPKTRDHSSWSSGSYVVVYSSTYLESSWNICENRCQGLSYLLRAEQDSVLNSPEPIPSQASFS